MSDKRIDQWTIIQEITGWSIERNGRHFAYDRPSLEEAIRQARRAGATPNTITVVALPPEQQPKPQPTPPRDRSQYQRRAPRLTRAERIGRR